MYSANESEDYNSLIYLLISSAKFWLIIIIFVIVFHIHMYHSCGLVSDCYYQQLVITLMMMS
jgi:hypothetical protein